MNNDASSAPPDGLDHLIASLLDCGSVLSQMIGGMVEWEASGRSDPRGVPIPETAHGLIRSVSRPVSHSHSKRDIKVAAKIVAQMTEQISSEIYAVDPDWYDEVVGASQPEAADASAGDAWLSALSESETATLPFDQDVGKFVLALLTTGRAVAGLVSSIAETLPTDAYPGEDPEDVGIEMLYGTIRTAMDEVDRADLLRAAELIDAAGERTIEHLRLALELRRRIENGLGPGRNYG